MKAGVRESEHHMQKWGGRKQCVELEEEDGTLSGWPEVGGGNKEGGGGHSGVCLLWLQCNDKFQEGHMLPSQLVKSFSSNYYPLCGLSLQAYRWEALSNNKSLPHMLRLTTCD